jgi:type VI secretion system protein ImpK
MTDDTNLPLDDGAFLDAARTIRMPTPGRRRERDSNGDTKAQAAPAPHRQPLADQALAPLNVAIAGRNPILRAANPLLELALPLRRLSSHPDLDALRDQLIQMVRRFETDGRRFGVPDAQLGVARYCLCTFIDESIAATPWGAGVWGRRSLLVTFHNEASGGERLFVILQRLAQTPATDIDMLELIYIMLALGFDGRYRLVEGGKRQLDEIRERLEQLIRGQRAEVERALSPHWRPAERERERLTRILPIWVAVALAGVVLMMAGLVLGLRINAFSDPVFAAMHDIHVAPAPVLAEKTAAAPKFAAALDGFLAPEIAQGLVTVGESSDRTTVTLNNTAEGTQIFASGSDELDAHFAPLVQRIGEALRDKPGNVVVIGHTDNQRIVSARFPSNVALSQARADKVRSILAAKLPDPARVSAEGRGDTEPLASNDTAAGRAQNRRVSIDILAPGATP